MKIIEVIKPLGGVQTFQAKLADAGLEVQPKTIYSWGDRGVPLTMIPSVHAALVAMGSDLEVSDVLRMGTDHARKFVPVLAGVDA